MTETTLVQAINLALARAMTEDERVIVLGEDGGVFRATDGLFARFGAERVRDTPYPKLRSAVFLSGWPCPVSGRWPRSSSAASSIR